MNGSFVSAVHASDGTLRWRYRTGVCAGAENKRGNAYQCSGNMEASVQLDKRGNIFVGTDSSDFFSIAQPTEQCSGFVRGVMTTACQASFV